jgi:plasmid maintenance system antidote protein VapI
VAARRINEIVHGHRRISADTVLRLARFFGTSERFWINLQDAQPELAQRHNREAPVASMSTHRMSDKVRFGAGVKVIGIAALGAERSARRHGRPPLGQT